MKYRVTFEPNSDLDIPCCAATWVNGIHIIAVGATWERAEERLTKKIRQMETAGPVPEPKNIEV